MPVHEKILQWLENEIFEGNLRLGQNLPDDRRIAAAIGSSNSSTREALKTLETMGIVRLYAGKRKTIIAHLSSVPLSSAGSALRLHMADARYPLRDTVQTQILLESWAVAQSGTNTEALQELESIVEAMLAENVLPPDFHALEVDFHIAITKLSGNHMITAMLTMMRETLLESKIEMLGRVPLWSAFATRALAEYQAILSAVKSEDRDLAARLIVANIEGQYEEADLNLDEETLLANALPGTPASSYFEPIEDDLEDLVPEEWEEAVSDDLLSALASIQPVGAPEPAASSEPAPSDPTEPAVAEPVQAQSRSEEHRVPEPAQPAYKIPVDETPAQKTSERKTPVQETRAPQTPTPVSSAPVASALDDPAPAPQSAGDRVLRAPESKVARRRRGTVSTPVHATVIRPRQSTAQQAMVVAGHLNQAEPTVRVAPADTVASKQSWAEQDGDVLRAVPRQQVEKTGAEKSAAYGGHESSAAGKKKSLLNRLFGSGGGLRPSKQELVGALPQSAVSGEDRLPAAQKSAVGEPKVTVELTLPEEAKPTASDSPSAEGGALPEGYVVYDGAAETPVYEDDVPEDLPALEDNRAEAIEISDAASEESAAQKPSGNNVLNKGKKRKKKRR